MAADPRTERLRAAVLAVAPSALRDAVRSIPEATVRALPARSRPVVSQLKRSANQADLLRRLPDLQVIVLLADVLSDDCLLAIRDALGDAADDPTREQLVEAIDTVLESFDLETVRVMLATVSVSGADAADLCDALLSEDERFAIEVTESAPAPSTPRAPKAGASDEVKEARRQRKEAERERKAQQQAKAPPSRHKRRLDSTAPVATASEVEVPAVTRRAPVLPPVDAAVFSSDDPLVGSVVIAIVPFDDDVGAKPRPAVVIGTSPDELLVRPGYSEGGLQSRRWQSHELRDWPAAGLMQTTWIVDQTRMIRRSDVTESVGRLTDDDWNALW